MDLSGEYRIKIAWQKPQKILVKRVGRSYLFSFIDQLERQVFVEGKEVGFNVVQFLSRDLFHLTEFVVLGTWDQVTYRDWKGRLFEVEVNDLAEEC